MKKGRKAKPAEDFMGHVFPSFADMAAYWGLPVQRTETGSTRAGHSKGL